nr:unnamed protein product [Spirometra erinaceieuropaei]
MADISVVVPASFRQSSTLEFQTQASSCAPISNKSAEFSSEIKIRLPPNSSDDFYLLFTFSHYRASSSPRTAPEKKMDIGGSGTRSPLLGCLMQAKLQDITLHIGALMDGLLQALGISLVLSPLPDNSVISQSPAANLLAVIAYVVFRVSSGHPDWMEEETQRSRILCGYLAGTSGLTETAALPYFLSGVPLFGMARTYIQETVQNKALIIEKPEFCEDLLLLTTKTAKHICSRLAETISASDGTTVAWADALQQLDIRRHLGNSLPNEIGLNRSLAFFLCDAFGFINATIIYQQISTYLGVIDERIQHLTTVDKQEDSDLISPQAANEIRCLVFLKLEFLQIVSSTRDFLTLSFPTDNSRLTQLKTIADADFFRSISPADSILHSPIYRTVHFLPYLILTEVHQCLASPDIQLQEQSMGLLWYCMRNLEASPCDIHLFDRPLANCLPDVSLLYLPLLEIACDFAPALLAHWLQEDESDGDGSHKSEGRANSVVPPAGGELGGGTTTTTTNDREQLRQMSIQSGRKLTDPAQAGALETESSGTRCPQSTSEPKSGLSTTKISTNPTTHFQSILPHFSFSFKHVPKAHQEWSLDSIRRLLLLALWVLHQCRDTLLAEWMLRTGTQMAERLSSLLLLALQYFEYKEPRPGVMEDIQSNVAPQGVSDSNRPHGKDMTPSPLQSLYLQAAFDALKVYAKSDMVIDVEQRQLETILAHQRRIFHSSCSSGMQYAVLTSQFHAAGGFYAQLSISLEIWMEIVACFHHLQRFQTEKISAAATEREHALNLSETILRMATASRLVPELRQNWLLRLAEINLLLNQPAEAAQCLLHILASVVEQLVNRNIWPQFLQTGGASTIADQVMSVNLLEECSVEAAVGLPTVPPCSRFLLRTSLGSREREERAPDSQQSLTGLIGQLHELVEKAVDCLIAADQFEIVTLLCHWLMPILASMGQHERLSKIHELVSATHSAAAASAEERRLCSSYFRVGFYGRKFDELDGREFVYKETPLTKLSEVTARLKEYYDKRFGNSNVFVLKDSKKVNSEDLDEGKLYIQITYVEPYYSQFEARRKATIFGRNYGIKKFLIVTPFTMSGAARGRLTEQYQRNTIITTARTFPYLTTRVEIVAREDVVLSPMEVALQDVIQRNRQLTRALTVHPPDAKFLQMVLQGCVSTTVNQGPLEVARLFLGHSSPRTGTDGEDTLRIKNSLRISLKEFLRKSEEAIDVNRRLIGPDQEEYQQELERSFGEIKRQMSPLLRPNCISRLHSEF